ncbi:MAG: glycoside-pentoside-hexuronide (GPH):cation symporter [Clostridiales bacterium]|jgi:GPH family glycoside/pentoside/hexuronide:cation symporter|nr:glycoside-pentoside-hexuronide (GPH):cation symporter [Clostridiales bacterium]
MNEKKYLKNWQKVAYGSGDMGSNFMFTFVSSFILIYLTNTVGMNSGIVGTLMMASKLLDGVTDVFFGGLMDNTKSKMGKARPWMFWSTFPLALCEMLLFMIPNTSEFIQYAYFFIIYTLLNAVFYTANNIAYGSLTALMTKNPNERVQVGSIRFMFALVAGIGISSVTMGLVGTFGGNEGNFVAGWRMTAIVFSLLMVLFNMICVLSVKEVPDEDSGAGNKAPVTEKRSFASNIKLLVSNKFYLLILSYYIVTYMLQGISSGVGIYFCTYALGDPSLLGLISMAGMIPIIIGLAVTPMLVKKFGTYRVNLTGLIISVIFSIPVVIFGYMGNLPLFLASQMIKGLGSAPMIGTLYAVIADAAQYTFLKDTVHLDGTMYSCSSMGMKLGSGIGSAICGWLLALSGYNGLVEIQTAGAINMIRFMYLAIPAAASVLVVIIVASLNVQKAVKELETATQA